MSNFKLNNILFAGSTGFIGSYLSKNLFKDDTSSLEYNNINGNYNNDYNYTSIQFDLTDLKKVNDWVSKSNKFDVLIFLVGLAHTKGIENDIYKYNRINYETLKNLISTLAENKKLPNKIIFASSISVYGEKYYQSIYNENVPTKPINPYAVSKLKAEKYLKKNFGNRSWILRFAPVYSFEFTRNLDRRTQICGKFYKVGRGINKLSLCNVANIKVAVEGIIKDKVPSGIYNVSDLKFYTYNQLLEWRNAKSSFCIPEILVKSFYFFGTIFRNNFLHENSIKLLSDNIYPNSKLISFVNLPYFLDDIKFKHKNHL